MAAAGLTDIGRVRSQNQDTIFVSPGELGLLPNLFIVADGMGGHNAGDVASQLAVSAFCEYIRGYAGVFAAGGCMDLLVSAVMEANRAVYRKARTDSALKGMGTTFTACVAGGGKCDIVHVGDSRAYFIADGEITQLTTDHSYVNEMVKAGQLTQSQAREHPKRNILTRVLGVDLFMEADGYVKETKPGGLILLCSDGLTNMLDDSSICEICCTGGAADEKVRALIEEANNRGGADNISAVLID